MSITCVIGPMFSGKTTELIRLIERKMIAGKKCLIIKHSHDTRYGSQSSIGTHGKSNYSKCPIITLGKLDLIFANKLISEQYQVVAIDEGFFFDFVAEFANHLANNKIDVICSSLESNYKQQVFENIAQLMIYSEKIIKLSAVCNCCKSKNAHFTIRIDAPKHIPIAGPTQVSLVGGASQDIIVGGSDKYSSVCRNCLQTFNQI